MAAPLNRRDFVRTLGLGAAAAIARAARVRAAARQPNIIYTCPGRRAMRAEEIFRTGRTESALFPLVRKR